MSDYYTISGEPVTDSSGDSSVMRAEFALISAGFDKLPDLTTVANRVAHVNAGSTAFITTAGFTFDGTTFTAPALAVTNNSTLTGDLAVNGGDLTTSAATFNLLNATATTLNIGGAATTIAIGAATGTLTVANTTLAAKAGTFSTTLSITGALTYGGVTLTAAVTGTGKMVLDTSPALVTPSLGVATATSLSAPTILTASGALNITPAAGSGLNINLSTTGDFAVNTNQLYVDTSTGNVGIGTVSPGAPLEVLQTGASVVKSLLKLRNSNDDTGTGVAIDFAPHSGGVVTGKISTIVGGVDNYYMAFSTWSGSLTEKMRITNVGNVCIGTTGDITLGNANRLHVSGITAATNSIGVSAWSADALGSRIELGKSRGAAISTNTIVQDGDAVGALFGYGANGSTFTNLASISMEVDGTPGASNDMPGRIVFKTTPNGSGTLTEALRLSQDQTALFSGGITATTGTFNGNITATVASDAVAINFVTTGSRGYISPHDSTGLIILGGYNNVGGISLRTITSGSAVERLGISNAGAVTLSNLAGVGTRTVVVDANGVLSAP